MFSDNGLVHLQITFTSPAAKSVINGINVPFDFSIRCFDRLTDLMELYVEAHATFLRKGGKSSKICATRATHKTKSKVCVFKTRSFSRTFNLRLFDQLSLAFEKSSKWFPNFWDSLGCIRLSFFQSFNAFLSCTKIQRTTIDNSKIILLPYRSS